MLLFEDDALIPDPVVARKLGVTPMTLYRRTRDPKLNFPQPVKFGPQKNARCYRKGRELNEYLAQAKRDEATEQPKAA